MGYRFNNTNILISFEKNKFTGKKVKADENFSIIFVVGRITVYLYRR